MVSILVLLGALATGRAQSYRIDWFTMGGGGGTSTGGAYALSGTLGQSAATQSKLTGGVFSVTGGFWSLFAFQTGPAPMLRITSSLAGTASISWSPDGPGFVLQETTVLTPTQWTNSPSGTNHPVEVAVPASTRFYRLRKP
jgi:hypothetical protein